MEQDKTTFFNQPNRKMNLATLNNRNRLNFVADAVNCIAAYRDAEGLCNVLEKRRLPHQHIASLDHVLPRAAVVFLTYE